MNYSTIDENLAKRASTRIATSENKESKNIILLSPSDLGVYRNGGRRGSSFGPQAILNQFKKFSAPENFDFTVNIICNQFEEDFSKLQQNSIETLDNIDFKSKESIIHLGGGHDHIYPLLKSLEKTFSKIVVLNIDPHLDTRQDEINHSGTPFRQFSNETKCDFRLIQISTEQYANAKENYNELKHGEMKIISFDELKNLTRNFSSDIGEIFHEKIDLEEDELLVISIDADVVSANAMEAVSATNPEGLPPHVLFEIIEWAKNKKSKFPKITGIYEHNPLFDNLSCKGSKLLAKLIYTNLI